RRSAAAHAVDSPVARPDRLRGRAGLSFEGSSRAVQCGWRSRANPRRPMKDAAMNPTCRLATLCVTLLVPALVLGGEAAVRKLKGHEGSVLSVVFSPDGRTLASCSRDRTVKLWDPATGELKHTLTEHTADVYTVRFSPKGELLA